MQKLIVLYPTQSDPEAFKSYYLNNHLPLVRNLPGLQRMDYSFDVEALGGDMGFTCVFEAQFADEAAFGAAMGSSEGQAVSADIPNFVQVPPIVFRYSVADSSGQQKG